MLYVFGILFLGCLLGYGKADPSLAVSVLATLLTVPVIAKLRAISSTATLAIVFNAINGLLFAVASYGLGRAAALFLGA